MVAAVGVVADIIKVAVVGQSFLKSITSTGDKPDFYKIRMEIGNNQDASGNPPSIILTDFSNTQRFGVFQGTSKKSSEMCRNNQDLPKGEFDDRDLSLFKGLKNGEAPINTFNTANGFNLKSVDLQGGGNAVCISNLIFKGSDTQARRDEIFLPIGDLGFLCGKEWNWGTMLGETRQRCIWLDGQPDGGKKPMESIHLDMERIAGIFNVGKDQKLKDLDLNTACSLFSDSTGQIPNRNACKTSYKRDIQTKDVNIDTVPLVNMSSIEFSETQTTISLERFVGAGFVTMDKKFFISETRVFKEVSLVKQTDVIQIAPPKRDLGFVRRRLANSRLHARGLLRKRRVNKMKKMPTDVKKLRKVERKMKKLNIQLRKRETTAQILKVQTCQATTDGVAPSCITEETVAL